MIGNGSSSDSLGNVCGMLPVVTCGGEIRFWYSIFMGLNLIGLSVGKRQLVHCFNFEETKLSLHFFSQRREPGRGRGLRPGGRAGHPAQAQAEAIQDHFHRIPVGK